MVGLAFVCVEALVLLDVIACEEDDVPSARSVGLAWLEPETLHGSVDLPYAEFGAHVLSYEFDDACGGDELALFAWGGESQVGEDEFFFVAHLFEVTIVLF